MHHTMPYHPRILGGTDFTLSGSAQVRFGRRVTRAVKSGFPGYADLRAAFLEQLDDLIRANAEELIEVFSHFLEYPIDPVDLPDVSDIRLAMLAEWESRLAAIWAEWNSHPQRLRPVRASMEVTPLSGFASLVSETRQRALGVEQYVWRSRDDAKVRHSHAEYDDPVFAWDDPPEGGYPGQEINCR
jgi:hypothetical protein